MNKDASKGQLKKVYVDGGMTANRFFLQLLANILGVQVGKYRFPAGTHMDSLVIVTIMQWLPSFVR